MSVIARPWEAGPPVALRSVAAGLIAGVGLLGVYVGIIGVAQGFDHALEQFATDALFVALIALGFGTQVALFVELRAVGRVHRGAAAVTAAGTGTSAAAMLACCAHHLVDILPILGLSAAAVFLNTYKTPLFLVSLSINAVGIVVIARQLRRARAACAVIDRARGDPANTPETTPANSACH